MIDNKMKAIIHRKYGGPEVLELAEVAVPRLKSDEVLVRVRAVALNAADWRFMRAKPGLVRLGTGLFRPKRGRLGSDLAGSVEAVGADVTRFKAGDEVFADLSECGRATLAEYVAAPAEAFALKPPDTSFEAVAALPLAGTTALQALKGRVSQGQSVLINGAAGGVGTFALQIAKAFGAVVTAVCGERHMELMRDLGADAVVNYSKEDVTKGEQHYDLIVGVNGYHSLSDYMRVLKPAGTYVALGGAMSQIFQAMLLGPLHSRKGGKQIVTLLQRPSREDLEFIGEMLASGEIKPVIEHQYVLAQVPEAIAYLEAGHVAGKLIINIE